MKTAIASDQKKARSLVESKGCEIIVLDLKGHDQIKNLFTIINPIIARIAHTNNVAIGLDIKTIAHLNSIEKARVLARLREVIKYCRKAHTKIATNLPRNESIPLLLSLGASTEQLAQSITQAF